MKNLITVIIILLLQQVTSNAQSTFKVLTKQQQTYQFVPNPIEYAKYGVDARDIRMQAINGKVDTIEGVIYWTPQQTGYEDSDKALLIIQERNEHEWSNIDTIQSSSWTITPNYFSAEPRPVGGFSHGYTDLFRFKYLKLTLPYKFSHLSIDSLCRVLSFDAIMLATLSKWILFTLSLQTNLKY